MSIFFKSFLVLVAGLLLTISVSAQSLTGQWVGLWRTLDNGEKDRMFLDLQQTGDHVAGTVTTIGHSWTVHGSVTTLVNGVHTEIFLSPRDKQPRLVGDLADNELHLIRDGASFTAKPGSSSDQYPTIQFISPPALDSVPGNGLAARPPMGWNSWNLFESRIDDKTVREMADALVTTGMRDAGYVYVNIDDTWEGIRDAQGQLSSNQKFPDMKSLANYLHSRGLKLGIYSSPGERTCAEYPGSYGHEDQDAKTFAAWGIDYLKYDWCGARMIYTADDLRAVYQTMGRSLLKAGRPMVYSLCEYGDGHVETWGVAVGANLWRTTGDIKDSWASMIANIEKQAPLAAMQVRDIGMIQTCWRSAMDT
jgi:alpha-galactosidase